MKIVPLRQICRTMEVLMLGGGFQGVVIRSRQKNLRLLCATIATAKEWELIEL